MAEKRLSAEQEKFCVEFAKSGNMAQAYVNAGYKAKTQNSITTCASQLLKKPNIKKRLEELTAETKNNDIADIREMQEALTKIIRQELEEQVLMTEGRLDGETEVVTKTKKSSIKDIISAINTLGKMQGAFIDKVAIDGAIPIVISGDGDLVE